MNNINPLFFATFIAVSLFTSCMQSDVYEKNVALPSTKWNESNKPSFTFDITDTVASYTMSLTMRHTDAYSYSNIWLNVTTTPPNEKTGTTVKIEVPLAQPDGKWLGRGMNEIWEHRMPLSRNGEAIYFKKKGVYTIQLEQIMRVNPLPEVMSVGVRLEKNK